MKNTLIEQGKNLLETGYYNQGAYKIAEALNLKMKVKHHSYGKHWEGDTDNRHRFKVTLFKEGKGINNSPKQYSFKFGQSIAEGSNEPTLYDVLACLQKYEVGTFEDFCGEFGYDEDSRSAKKIYKAVLREYANMERLFTEEELEILQEIN